MGCGADGDGAEEGVAGGRGWQRGPESRLWRGTFVKFLFTPSQAIFQGAGFRGRRRNHFPILLL